MSLLCRQEAVHSSRGPPGVFTVGDQEVTPNTHSTNIHNIHVFWRVDYRGQWARKKTAHNFAWLTSSIWCDGQLDRPVPTVGCVIWEQVAFFTGTFKHQVERSAQFANQGVYFVSVAVKTWPHFPESPVSFFKGSQIRYVSYSKEKSSFLSQEEIRNVYETIRRYWRGVTWLMRLGARDSCLAHHDKNRAKIKSRQMGGGAKLM